jgi:hypothetical protein
MAIDNRYEEEDVDGATSSKGGDNYLYTIKSYQQLKAHREAMYRDTHQVDREVYLVDQDSAEAAYRERNHEVDRRESHRSGLPKMITESR